MPHDEPIQTHRPRSTFSTWIGVLLLFAFFGILALVLLAAAPRGDTYEKKRARARLDKLEAANKETFNSLTTYGWVDKTKGVARIPVTEAMKLTVAELAQKKPEPAGPIATPAAQPAPASAASPAASPGAAAASPAPPASASPAVSATVSPTPSASPSGTPKAKSVTGPDSENRGQPAATNNPPAAAPGTQPGASATPAASPGSAAAKGQTSPSPGSSPTATAPGTPLPVRGKKP